MRSLSARWWRVAVERLTLYLPVMLMGLLALASYWLLRATPATTGPAVARAEAHHPHHVMRQFSVRTHGAGGALKTEVLGSEARLFPDDGSMEVDNLRVRSFSPDGVLTTLSGDLGWVNKAHDEFVLRRNARMVREAATLPNGQQFSRLEFQGNHLHVYTDTHRVLSDEPVVLLRGADRLSGNRLDYNDEQRVAVLTGRVRAQFIARPQP
jgi:lipopolysaccharide export system protein LptC